MDNGNDVLLIKLGLKSISYYYITDNWNVCQTHFAYK